ncbi:hypothetical protein CBE37_01545 [bacterium TMED277]|nr:UDP-sulfoquinovose synthase [Candidatus Pelagibacter sp.]OUX44229.1 MAG: hypothetical protein CBE37_01545 [bacterium TMED277]|tara:strand:- start:10252 stop:11361 length:1110 start_codon:yes stop_codon:yes gene_type:complete
MNILITGCDGYIGWPLFLKFILKNKKDKILGIDNFARRKWVKEVKSSSSIKIYPMKERLNELKKNRKKNFKFIKGDLQNKDFLFKIIKSFKPNVILHLAAQPSAPYANSSFKRSYYTIKNNNISTLNILWSLKELRLENKTLLITTTTTGVYGAPDFSIPEGFLVPNKFKIPYGNMGGSWYHITKSNDVNHLWLANKLWGTSIIDFRTAITIGVSTNETKLSKIFSNRFDHDFYFGVVINRFIYNSLRKKPILIYGKGKQKKPFIHLEDAVDSLYNSVKLKIDGKFRVFNQFSETLSIKDAATIIKKIHLKNNKKVKIKHIKNPRKEDEKHNMKMLNKGFLKILKRKPLKLKQAINSSIEDLSHINEED